MKLILGSVIFLIMGVCFFRISYHAVLLGRPVDPLKLILYDMGDLFHHLQV